MTSDTPIRSRSTQRIMSRRLTAAWWWNLHAPKFHHDRWLPRSIPGYFIDRYAFWLAKPIERFGYRPRPPKFNRRALGRTRDEYLRRYLLPSTALGGWMPIPSMATGVGDLYDELRSLWLAQCYRVGLVGSVTRIPDVRELTWRDIFDASVFYPRPPVFRGATYWDRLPDERRRRLIATYGSGAPVDFYCFMQQVHETVHAAQTGEPLLNEIVQAAIWTRFLDANSLWAFQTRSDGTAMIREYHVIRQHNHLLEQAVAAKLDTAVLLDRLAPTDAYELCCTAASVFEHSKINYARYLDVVCIILTRANDPAWLRRARQRICDSPRPPA